MKFLSFCSPEARKNSIFVWRWTKSFRGRFVWCYNTIAYNTFISPLRDYYATLKSKSSITVLLVYLGPSMVSDLEYDLRWVSTASFFSQRAEEMKWVAASWLYRDLHWVTFPKLKEICKANVTPFQSFFWRQAVINKIGKSLCF